MSDQSESPSVKADVTMPLGFTDAVKAIREALGLIGDISSKVGAVSEAYRRQKGRKAAGHIDTLGFRSDGSRKHLEKIAAGEGQQEDFEAIAQRMDETGAKVESALAKIKLKRGFIRERFGARTANKIDMMIYAGRGKQSIRMDLVGLAGMNHSHYSLDDIAAQASHIIVNIEKLNEELAEVHDLLAGVTKG